MAVKKEIPRADGSGVTTFYRLSSQKATVEVDDSEGQETTFDYNDAQNKPSINDVALVGNKTSTDLGLQPAGDYITNAQADAKFVDNDELAALNYVNQAQLTAAIANIQHFHREIVDGLPITGQDNVLYMVRKSTSGGDIYNEYIWVGLEYSTNGYELIGTTAADLTDFYTKSETNTLLDTKVSKRTGYDLSSNDYTSAEKTKLAGLENYDDTQLRAAIAALHNYDDTEVRADIAANADDIADNAQAISNIENELLEKLNMVRLIQDGDSWIWEDLEDNNLSLAQALALLVQDNYMLCIENVESDGKAMPAHYEITGTTQSPTGINIVYRDREDNARLLTIANNTYINTLLGKITHYTETVNALPISGNVGDICILGNNKLVYFYDGTEWVAFDKAGTIDLSNYLAKDNADPYTPTDRYNPATKLYVDSSIANIFIPSATSQLTNDSGFVTKSVSDLTHYYNKTNTYNKTEVDALIQGGYQLPIASANTLGGIKVGSNLSIDANGVLSAIGGVSNSAVTFVDTGSTGTFILEGKKPGIYQFNSTLPDIKGTSSNTDTWGNRIVDGRIYIFTEYSTDLPVATPVFSYLSDTGSYNLVGRSATSTDGLTSLGAVGVYNSVALLNGNQTINGTKTFSSIPQCTVTPSSNNDLVNKKYVDDMDSGFIGSPNVYAIEVVTAYPATEEPGHLYIKV